MARGAREALSPAPRGVHNFEVGARAAEMGHGLATRGRMPAANRMGAQQQAHSGVCFTRAQKGDMFHRAQQARIAPPATCIVQVQPRPR